MAFFSPPPLLVSTFLPLAYTYFYGTLQVITEGVLLMKWVHKNRHRILLWFLLGFLPLGVVVRAFLDPGSGIGLVR